MNSRGELLLIFYLTTVDHSSKSNVYSLTCRALALREKQLYYPYWDYTNLFIFQFVSLLCLRSTLHLFHLFALSLSREKFYVIARTLMFYKLPVKNFRFDNEYEFRCL